MTETDLASAAPSRAQPHWCDPVLQTMVGIADSSVGFEWGITVDVRGVVVSGLLIGKAAWFDAWTQFDNGNGALGFRSLIRDAARPTNTTDVQHVYQHLHLKEAQRWIGQTPMPSEQNLLWRCRLTDISAWSEGRMTERA